MYPEYAIGLMSGTSCDGMDCALVKFHALDKLECIDFISQPYPVSLREKLLQVANNEPCPASDILLLSTLLGNIMLEAAKKVCAKAGVEKNQIAFIASHGHTIQHIPLPQDFLGHSLRGTLQIGDVSALNEYFSCPCVSDFRVRDFAAGGQGAPLVPFSEYLLYRQSDKCVALQNIGGIGNVTVLPKNCSVKDVLAFDTGPGNMLLDQWTSLKFGLPYDEGGKLASSGKAHKDLLAYLLDDPYYSSPAPKTTGREKYGKDFMDKIENFALAHAISDVDVLHTLCLFTAKTIALALAQTEKPDFLLIGGGGAHNLCLLSQLKALLPDVEVRTQDEIGLSSDAKEAIAFAVLGKACLLQMPSSVIGATGAYASRVLGKIQY